MAYKHTHDFKKLLPRILAAQPAWSDLADAMSIVFQRQIVQARRYMERIRDSQKFRKGDFLEVSGEYMKVDRVEQRTGEFPLPELPERIIVSRENGQQFAFNMFANQEREYLVSNAKLLGFELVSEQFNNEDYMRIVDNAALYYPMGGTDYFVDFIGYIKNARFTFIKLWAEKDESTNEYVNLQQTPDGDPVWEVGGTWYPTSHVWLEYDIERVGSLPETELKELFFKVAPIQLVLDSFGGALYSESTLYVQGLNTTFSSVELVSTMALPQETPVAIHIQTPIVNYNSITLLSAVEL